MTVPLVFIPGSMCDSRIFSHQLAHVEDARPSAIPDQDSIEAMAAAVLDDAPVEFIPVGLSLGGIIAAEVAATAPDRIRALVLADTNLAPPDEAQLAGRRAWRDDVAEGGDEALMALTESGVERLTARPATHRDLILTMAADIGSTTFTRQNEALLHRRDRRDDLADLPTLLIVGALDSTCPPDIHADLQARISDAELAVLPEAGHLSSLDQPDLFTGVIVDWLSGR